MADPLDAPPPLTAAARAAMLRVDQAGEFGATSIYAGQLAVLGDRSPISRAIAAMAGQEERHRALFDRMLAERRVRPTLLAPLWDRAGHALGVVTALIGPEAAMACTEAVETEIDRHYGEQLDALGSSDPELSAAIADFRGDEVEHRDIATAAGAARAPGYALLSVAIRLGCRAAIAVSKRI